MSDRGAARSPGPLLKATFSLLSTALACISAYLLLMVLSFVFLDWRGSAGGSAGFLVLTALVSTVGWLLLFLPLVLLFRSESPLFRPAIFPWIGGAAGLTMFVGYFAWGGSRNLSPGFWKTLGSPDFWKMLRAFSWFGLYAMVVGSFAAIVYSVLLRRRTVCSTPT